MATITLIDDIRRRHAAQPPLPETDRLLAEFELRVGTVLPASMIEFFRAFGSASLFEGSFTLLPLPELIRASEAVYGEDSEDFAPSNWWAFCDCEDGDYVGLVLPHQHGGEAGVIDICHDDFPECSVIAESYEDFLTRLLASDGTAFWLKPGYTKVGKLSYEPPPSYWRRTHATWFSTLGPETGPSKCSAPDCTRLAIRSSTKCRAHHYEMIHRLPCPFPSPSEA